MSIRILLGQDNLIELEGGIMDVYRNFDRNCAIYYKQNGGTKANRRKSGRATECVFAHRAFAINNDVFDKFRETAHIRMQWIKLWDVVDFLGDVKI